MTTPQSIRPKFRDSDAEIIPLLAAGLINKQIAGRLRIREKTVKNRLSRMYARLHVCNRAEAVALWLEKGVQEAREGL